MSNAGDLQLPDDVAGWVDGASASGGHGERATEMIDRNGDARVTCVSATSATVAWDKASRVRSCQNTDGFVLVTGAPTVIGDSRAKGSDESDLANRLLQLYRRDGAAFLRQLSGHFAIVVHDASTARTILAIDRLGVKPLYFSETRSGLAFATRISLLANNPAIDLDLDPQSLFNYLYLHVIPAPATVFRQIEKVLPGSYVEFRRGRLTRGSWWSPQFTREQGAIDFPVRRTEFHRILRDSVRREIELGEEVGCFLSGGTDSSTIAGLLCELQGRPARTYSIGFDQQGFDEMEYARLAARHFGTDHHEYYVTPEDIVELVPNIAKIYGEPFGNSSVVPTYFCARMAGADGIDRLLGGDGGDELFGGNERYGTQVLFSKYEVLPAWLRRSVIEPGLGAFPAGDHIWPVRKARSYVEQARVPMPDRLHTYNHLYRLGIEDVIDAEFLGDIDIHAPMSHMRDIYWNAGTDHLINRMLALDLRLTLADNDLPKVNRMCQYAGVDVGFPLLSDELFDFSAELPVRMKVKGLKIRYFFKNALRGFLPDEIIRKQKHGFGLPFGDWLMSHDGLRHLALDSLHDLRQRKIVRSGFLDDLVDRRLAENPHYYGGLVWLFMILEQWLSTNGTQ